MSVSQPSFLTFAICILSLIPLRVGYEQAAVVMLSCLQLTHNSMVKKVNNL